MVAILTASASLAFEPPAVSAAPIADVIEFGDFTDLGGWTLTGRSAQLGNPVEVGGESVLRLMDSVFNSGGSAMLSSPLDLTTATGRRSFSIQYSFRVSNPRNGGADGLVLLFGSSDSLVGGIGGGIGYQGVTNTVAVEFDDWFNGGVDPNGNHVGIGINGNVDTVVDAPLDVELDAGDLWTAWVDYNGATETLEVRANTTGVKPSNALLAHQVDIVEVVGSDEVYLGFTSATGAAAATFDLHGFGLDPSPGDVDPGPLTGAGPTADAGPDQAVSEGSIVTLDGSRSVASSVPSLVASEAEALLPGGTSLVAQLDGIAVGTDGALTLGGAASVGEGASVPDTAIAYIVDVSGSAADRDGCGGDLNRNNIANQMIDCEIAAVLAVHAEVRAAGTVSDVALISFSTGATARDLNPTSVQDTMVSPDADADANGVIDLEQVARTLATGGSTNFDAPVATACALLAGSNAANRVAIFMSDGERTTGGRPVDRIPCDPAVTFETFAVGTGASCTSGPVGYRLIDISNESGGACINVPNADNLPSILPDAIGSRLIRAELTVDGGSPIDVSDSLTPTPPITGPGSAAFAFALPSLPAGDHEICLTIYGADSGGESSVTTCSTLTRLDDELTYSWRPISASGPPVLLSSTTSASPSFVAPDDGMYEFELTVTDSAGFSDADRVMVAVGNLDPAADVDFQWASAGDVTLVSGSFDDPGWLDTHTVTIDWGDGTVDGPSGVAVQGSGWGSFYGSHIFREPGAYDVVVTITDDDSGQSSVTSTSHEVLDAVGVWTLSETADPGLAWSGSSATISGRVHSNSSVSFDGSTLLVDGAIEYVTTADVTVNDAQIPVPTQVAPGPFPVDFRFEDFVPGGPVATSVGSAYHDMTSACATGTWQPGTTLGSGVYWVPCAVKVQGSRFGARTTIVAQGTIQMSGARAAFDPYWDGLLLLSNSSDPSQAIQLSNARGAYLGVLYAPNGGISMSLSDPRLMCGIYAQTIRLSGASTSIRGADCGRPEATTAPPLLVPRVSAGIEVDVADTSPGASLEYRSTLQHEGATLIVPAVIGLENTDVAPMTVGGYAYAIEYFSVTDGAWLPLATSASSLPGFTLREPLTGGGTMTMSLQPNETQGVVFSQDPVAGTVLAPGAYATWGSQAVIDLTPEQVAMLLDPTRTGGIRNRLEIEVVEPGLVARPLYRRGTDFVDQVRDQGADIRDAHLQRLLADGQLRVESRAILAPGETITVVDDLQVPTIAPRAASESDSGYLARLVNADGSLLVGVAFATATAGVGQLVAPQDLAASTEHVPVVSVGINGPASVVAGASVEFDVDATNIGSVPAGSVVLGASAADAALVVTGGPTALAPGEMSSASTVYTAPSPSDGSLVPVRATATWTDSSGNVFGPVGATVALQELVPATLGATLNDVLSVDADGDGRVSPGDTVRYTATVGNAGDVALTGVDLQVEPHAASALVPGSVIASRGSVTTGNGATDELVAVALGSVAGNSTASVIFDVVVDDPFPTGQTRLSAFAAVSADGVDPIQSDDPSTPQFGDPTITRVTVPYAATTAMLSSFYRRDVDQSGSVTSGDVFELQLVVNSTGSVALTDVVARLPVPGGFDVVSGSLEISEGTAAIVGDEVVVDVTQLASFTSSVVSIELAVGDPMPFDAGLRTTQATVTATGVPVVVSDDPATDAVDDPTVLFTATTTPGGGSGSGGSTGGGTGGGSEFPTASLSAATLAEGTTLTAASVVTATLTAPAGETLVGWTVSVAPADGGAGTVIASGTDANVSATIDPTLLANGGYLLVITSQSSGGGVGTSTIPFMVDGDFKPGRYQTTFQDLAVDIGGLPLQLNRTYDSFDKAVGDFGVGWKLDVADIRVSTNGPLGEGPWEVRSCGGALFIVYMCYSSPSPHYVSVTWPDGTNEVFDLTPARGINLFPGMTSAEFTPRAGSTSKLQAVDAGMFWRNGSLYGGLFGSGDVYDERRFRLTDSAGTEYLIEVGEGVSQMRDRNGQTVTITDAGVVSSAGPSMTYDRDALGRITQVDGPSGEVINYTYDAAGDLVSVTEPAGLVTELGYTGNHYLTSIGGAGQPPVRRLDYDATGRLASITDGNGNVVSVDIDLDARTETTTGPDPRLTTVYTSDAGGNLVRVDEVFEGEQITYRFEYDALDRRTRTIRPDGSASVATYTAKGQLATLVDPDGVVTAFTYDQYGQPLTVSEDGVVIERRTYDTIGNATSVEYADGTAESMEWSGGRLLASVDRAGNRITYTYDTNGFVASIAGPGGVARFTNDESGRTVTATAPSGAVLTYVRDAAGRVTSLTDGEGRTAGFSYDAEGRVTRMVDGLGDERLITYDVDGNVARIADRNGAEVSFTYGVYGQVLSRSTSTGVLETFEYDAIGRRTRATNAVADVRFEWDTMSNLDSLTTIPMVAGMPTIALDYQVSAAGQTLAVADPYGTTTYDYDDTGVLAAVTDSELGAFGLSTDSLGRLLALDRPNGVTTTFAYDGGRVASTATVDASGTTLLGSSYAYDTSGQLSRIDDVDGAHLFQYDADGRLVAADRPQSAGYVDESYSFDDAGNLTRWPGTALGAAQYDDANRLLRDGTSDYTYDAEGRLRTARVRATGVTTTYTWDALGRLGRVATSDGHATEYGYDALGRRVSMVVDGERSWIAYDGLNPRLVFSDDGTLVTRAVHTATLGGLLGQTQSGVDSYPVIDPDLSVVATTGSSGQLTGRFRYSSYGDPVSDVPTLQAWHGMTPGAFGDYLTYARGYDPGTGRFTSEDPLLATNAYVYAIGNPLGFGDPLGLSVSAEYGSLVQTSTRTASTLCGTGAFVGTMVAEIATDLLFTAALSAVVPNGPGLYGFTDKSGNTYVGRSVDLRRRILEHIRNGKGAPGSQMFIIKLTQQAAEHIDVAEQLLINRCGGVAKLANKVNAINKKRRADLAEFGHALASLFT